MSIQFSRNTKVFVESNGTYWKIPILEDFSFSQATNATEITLAEMEGISGVSRRGRTLFTDNLAPAEWSFSTYARPIIAGTSDAEGGWETDVANHHAMEEALWANFIGRPSAFNPGTTGVGSAWTGVAVTNDTNNVDFAFTNSNVTLLGEFNLYFVLGGCSVDETTTVMNTTNGQTVYRMPLAVVDSVSFDFEIDGIATLNWSGFASEIVDISTAGLDLTTATLGGRGRIDEGDLATNNFIRNRLSTLAITANDTSTFPGDGAPAGEYNVTLTGGSITFENNLTYLTPNTLCTVNKPLGSITGTRSIGGNFTAYLSGNSNNDGETAQLFKDVAAATDVVRNSFDLTFSIGGSTLTPRVDMAFPNCHLEIPEHQIEDVIALDVTFSALPTDLNSADEATITYTGPA